MTTLLVLKIIYVLANFLIWLDRENMMKLGFRP